MENQVQTIVCPNCGASATNHRNCEYCGSLLVRFTDKNIPLDETKYGHSAFKFTGLEDALTKNLEEQARTSGRNHIHTFINSPALSLSLDVTNPKAQTEMVLYSWGDANTFRIKPTIQPDSDEQSLVICIRFYEITNKLWAADNRFSHGITQDLNAYNNEAHARFQGIDIYDLFSLQTDTMVDEGSGTKVGNVYQYYLNFGRDVEGAASIITQYLLGNYEIANPQNMRLTYELSSLTDEEYNEGVKVATKNSKFAFSLTIIGAILFIAAGIWMLSDEEETTGIFTLLTGVGAFFYAIKRLKG